MSITLNSSTITLNSGAVLQDAVGNIPVYGIRASLLLSTWGGVISIKSSNNISSVVARATAGTFTCNFSNAMPTIGYAAISCGGTQLGNGANEAMWVIEETSGSPASYLRTTSSWPFMGLNSTTYRYGGIMNMHFVC
jgi:hypothetical protein